MKETKDFCQKVRTLVKKNKYESKFKDLDKFPVSDEVKNWYKILEETMNQTEESRDEE